MSKTKLEEVCHDVFSTQLNIPSEESAYLEESTRLQSLSPLWHQHREGRITSSLFKRVKNASVVNPPMPLVKTVWESINLIQPKCLLLTGELLMKT